MARILVTGASGYVGAALVPTLQRAGHELRAYARTPSRVRVDVPVVEGDATVGSGLDEALDGIDVAYYLIHSMESAANGAGFDRLELAAAEHFSEACARQGVRRVVYLGGPVPQDGEPSRHLRSRLAVEEVLLGAVPEAVAFRASIVVGARSRSFRFLVRLVERTPFLPLPGWRDNVTRPVDERDVLAFLAAAGDSGTVRGPLSLDLAGPDVVSYGQLVQRIRDHLLVGRPAIPLPVSFTPVAAQVAAAIAGEDAGLIRPLMESLESDLLPRPGAEASEVFPGVRLHALDASIERALRDWEGEEELRGR